MIFIHDIKTAYMEKYGKILAANHIPYEYIDSQDPGFWDKIRNAELFINYLQMGTGQLLRQHHLVCVIEQVLGIPCFPNWKTTWHYDDKVAETLLMDAVQYPLIESHVFWQRDKAMQWAANAVYPQVFKLKNGASSINVIKVENRQQAERLIRRMFGKGINNNRVPGSNLFSIYKRKPEKLIKATLAYTLDRLGLRYSALDNYDREHGYILFQRFIPNNHHDTRIHVIGKSAFALRRKNRPNDFRASGAGKIDFTPEKIDLRMVELAIKISNDLGFNAMTYDFLIDEQGNPVINEIGCQYADWAPYSFPGYWDEKLTWHPGHFWPQYIQLKYMLQRDDLQQPEIPFIHPKGYTFVKF
jgi:glutathione synthase/RimK-type ligase-like ATP-grasp enzyme